MITHLLGKGHTVKVASYDRGYQNLKDDFDVLEIEGFSIVSDDNKVSIGRTLLLYWIDSKFPIFSNRSILRNSKPIV